MGKEVKVIDISNTYGNYALIQVKYCNSLPDIYKVRNQDNKSDLYCVDSYLKASEYLYNISNGKPKLFNFI